MTIELVVPTQRRDPREAFNGLTDEARRARIARIAAILNREMASAGITTVTELARRSGRAKGTISNLLSGKSTPDITTLEAVTAAIGLYIDDVLGEAGYRIRSSEALFANPHFVAALEAAEEMGTTLNRIARLPADQRRGLEVILTAMNNT